MPLATFPRAIHLRWNSTLAIPLNGSTHKKVFKKNGAFKIGESGSDKLPSVVDFTMSSTNEMSVKENEDFEHLQTEKKNPEEIASGVGKDEEVKITSGTLFFGNVFPLL